MSLSTEETNVLIGVYNRILNQYKKKSEDFPDSIVFKNIVKNTEEYINELNNEMSGQTLSHATFL